MGNNNQPTGIFRWQLLDVPMDLATFNSLPKVTPHFFQFSMKIRSKIQNPVEFRVRSDIRIASHEHMRFKFKLYPSEEVENSILNNYVFCHLVEDRLVGCFGITPPTEGRYYFKVSLKMSVQACSLGSHGTI